MRLDDQINTIHTPCKSCVFAKYDNNTQNGCELNYLDKYRTKNASILEAYDDEKEFYIINGKKCMGYRENKWFKQFNLENSDIESKIKIYKEKNYLDYICIINLDKINTDNLDSILHQISQCKIQPKKVIIIRHLNNEKIFTYQMLESLFNKYHASYIWRIQTILDTSLTNDQIIKNLISLNAKYRFVVLISNISHDIDHMIMTTNQIVHEDLDQFEVLTNKDNTCFCFSSLVYRFEALHGNNLLTKNNEFQII